MTVDVTGLSAFPLTPLADDVLDENAFAQLVERLASAGVDSITALGSTGSAAYLTVEERRTVARLAVEHAAGIPVFVGIGALRTSHVIANAEAARDAGAAGLLLAPMTYQRLTADDVFELYRTVTAHTDLPVIVYDNPGTTHVTFTNELYARVAALPGIASLKIPPVPADPETARGHVAAIRAVIPADVTIGISGDASAASGLTAGCDAWYSVIGGLFPEAALTITRAAQGGAVADAVAESERLAPLWDLFAEFGGSIRVVAAIAEHLGLAPHGCLPLPIQPLSPAARTRIAAVVEELGLR
ncbi:dihydrodipicolinate synthase family protein [Microbacterium sp. SORGH_AS_0888]|uniref:dihydrodipicolinate synthase family protein n=1 Tax=Microbacterium sp. SORGH_AS_0888 TaxID=3041791 RepID=UPI0027883BFC|nr:dihydrodipicolinate synthase family protein [Microbacterium sp. SORGH_AS_0888]MDQ1130328.1 4-hydroxy-tetrahydrodipicolinate synthase [Microbacterium sp. SORGH_AS_0888]